MSAAAEGARRDQPLTALRLRLRANGYPPVPVSGPHMRIDAAGKRPVMKDWRRICAAADEAEVRGWVTTALDSTNTGILCTDLACVDIDVPVPELAAQIEDLAFAMLGRTPLRRIGQAPKVLLVYRTAVPLPKMATPEMFLPDGTKLQVEILGDGQQFVAYGEHPVTWSEYEWPETGPDVVARSDLLPAAQTELCRFLAAVEIMLRSAGGQTKVEGDAGARKAVDGLVRPPGQTSAEPIQANSRPLGGMGGDSFFKAVNRAALDSLDTWVPKLFPEAKRRATGGYRVTSADLGRDYEEDLSIHTAGVQDFGPRTGLSPCDLVMEWGGAPTVQDAAHMLCEWLGRPATDFGWKVAGPKTSRFGSAADPQDLARLIHGSTGN